MPRAAVYERKLEAFGTITVTPVDPAEDIDLIHDWVSQERARFWGMADTGREGVLEIYEFLDSLPTHHAFLLHRDGVPVGLFQSYQPEHDPISEYYEVQPGDVGLHLLIGTPATPPEPGFTDAILRTFIAFLFEDPHAQRILAEPDARNAQAIARLERTGFTLGPEVTLPEKPARLTFLPRATFETE
ncbi:GNAT family N-acetyltransferase [Kribbella deserti]|uniref:Lysine N-acyltransferase MbtK n=1 Tax=Kribbella deserti TaxID=1926257 RepID=A0ABV6QEA1_9ACTN